MRQQLCGLLVGIAVAAASVASLTAQGSTAKPANNIVVIGCLEGAKNVFTLKDYRSGRSYRIDADLESIGWHVGHELEIHGSLEVRTDGPRIKADQIIYVATRCSPPPPSPQ
jgi:hypothetical protein